MTSELRRSLEMCANRQAQIPNICCIDSREIDTPADARRRETIRRLRALQRYSFRFSALLSVVAQRSLGALRNLVGAGCHAKATACALLAFDANEQRLTRANVPRIGETKDSIVTVRRRDERCARNRCRRVAFRTVPCGRR